MTTATETITGFATCESGTWSARSGWRAVYVVRDGDGRADLVEWPVAGWATAGGAVWPVVAPGDATAPGLQKAGAPDDPRREAFCGVLAPGAGQDDLADLDSVVRRVVNGDGAPLALPAGDPYIDRTLTS